MKGWNESIELGDQLAQIFPENGPFAPGDRERRYRVSNVEVYFQEEYTKAYEKNVQWPKATREAAVEAMTEVSRRPRLSKWVKVICLANTLGFNA